MSLDSRLGSMLRYIREGKIIEQISNQILLIIFKENRDKVELTKERELIEFKIRGNLSYFYHLVSNRPAEEASYAAALHSQLSSLLLLVNMTNKVNALKFITNICKAYEAGNEVALYSAQSSNKIENMEIG